MAEDAEGEEGQAVSAPDRRKYIGGGAISSVLGVSPYRTALELWEEMTSDEPPRPPDPERERFFRRRSQMEPIVVRMLEEDHGIVATKVSFREPNRYRDPLVPYFAAEIDFETVMTPMLAERFPRLANVPVGEVINGEIKALNPRSIKQWGEPDAEEIPTHTASQALWGLGVTDRAACLVCPLFGIDELPVYPILHDPQVIAWMRREADAFMTLVRERRPPAPKPRSLEDLKRWAARVVGVPVDLDEATAATLTQIFSMRAEATALGKRVDTAEHALFEFVRKAWSVPSDPTVDMPTDNAVLRYQGKPLAVWRRQTKESVDVERLRSEDPMTFHRFKRESVFRVLAKPPKGSQ